MSSNHANAAGEQDGNDLIIIVDTSSSADTSIGELQIVEASENSKDSVEIAENEQKNEDQARANQNGEAEIKFNNVQPPPAHNRYIISYPPLNDEHFNHPPPYDGLNRYRPLESYANKPGLVFTGQSMSIAEKLKHLTTANTRLCYLLYPFHRQFILLHRLLLKLNPLIRCQSGLIYPTEVEEAQKFAIAQLFNHPDKWGDFIIAVLSRNEADILAFKIKMEACFNEITLDELYKGMLALDTCCGLVRHKILVNFTEKISPLLRFLPYILGTQTSYWFNSTWLSIVCSNSTNQHVEASFSLKLWSKYDAFTLFCNWANDNGLDNHQGLVKQVIKSLLDKALNNGTESEMEAYCDFVTHHLSSVMLLLNVISCAVFEHLCSRLLQDDWINLTRTQIKVKSYEQILRHIYDWIEQLFLPATILSPQCKLDLTVDQLTPLRQNILPQKMFELFKEVQVIQLNQVDEDWKSHCTVVVLSRMYQETLDATLRPG